jgi:hypothetical protein
MPVEVAQPLADRAEQVGQALPESAVRRPRLLLEDWMTKQAWLAVPTRTELVRAPVVWAARQALEQS